MEAPHKEQELIALASVMIISQVPTAKLTQTLAATVHIFTYSLPFYS